MKTMKKWIFPLTLLFIALSCSRSEPPANVEEQPNPVAAIVEEPAPRPFTIDDIVLEKNLLYDRHTLADTFPDNNAVRFFQFEKIRERLFLLDSIQQEPSQWAVLQNRQNKNGESPLVKSWHRDTDYNLVVDDYGVSRFQSVALYAPGEADPERYGRDGALMKFGGVNPDSTTLRLEGFNEPGQWDVQQKYVHRIADRVVFTRAVMVDRTNQCIATIEKADGKWLIRSMNPCTTGALNPPYGRPTPVGMFVVQEKKQKMLYTKDGSSELAGFAPWASRFCNGAYLHGVPTNDPNGAVIEFGSTLGTIPRSHMCVRNASSHAKFIYDWGPVDETIVFVYD